MPDQRKYSFSEGHYIDLKQAENKRRHSSLLHKPDFEVKTRKRPQAM